MRLFGGDSLEDHLNQQTARAIHQVKQLSDAELMSKSADDWIEQLVAEFDVQPPRLRTSDQEAVEAGSTAHVELRVPVDGDPRLVSLRPNVFSTTGPPQGRVDGTAILLPLGRAEDLAGRGPQAAARATAKMRPWMRHTEREIEGWRERFHHAVSREVNDRWQAAHSHTSALSSLGLPLRRRSDAPASYASDAVVRRAAPARESAAHSAAAAPSRPQPQLTADYYEHILKVIRAAGHAMERAPQTYSGWGEEDRRQVLLLMLNSHYEGKAHAEAFNGAGKTDILLREEDRNLFIAECKLWEGPSAFHDAITQLFGYVTWRDVKLALVVFVDRKDFTRIIATARETVQRYEGFRAWLSTPEEEESEFRAQVQWPGDPQRLVTLHVSLFLTPRSAIQA